MLLLLLRTFISALRSHRALALENLALRHQLEVLKRNTKRPHIKNRDWLFWTIFARIWSDWRKQLLFVRPETVIRWHKAGFRRYWRWKSRPKWPGRRAVPNDIRDLIRTMSQDNPLSLLKMSSVLTSLYLHRFHYIIDFMFLIFLRTLFSALRSHRALALENLALGYQKRLSK